MKTIILIISLMLSLNIFADINIGAKVGMNYNNIFTDKLLSNINEDTEYNLSYQYGIFLNANYMNKLFAQVELNINRKGFVKQRYEDGKELYETMNNILEYSEIPLLFGYKTDFGVYFFGGLYWSEYIESYSVVTYDKEKYGYENHSTEGYYDGAFEENINGYILGVGYEYKNYFVELRYNQTTTTLDLAGEGFSTRADSLYQISLSIGGYLKIF